jgi:hypothetical protein
MQERQPAPKMASVDGSEREDDGLFDPDDDAKQEAGCRRVAKAGGGMVA